MKVIIHDLGNYYHDILKISVPGADLAGAEALASVEVLC